MSFFDWFLNTQDFLPRWLCGGFNTYVKTGWTYIAANLGIFGAYSAIPVLLLYFISKKPDMAFPRIFWLFAAFIFLCGISHLLDALLFWWPAYRVVTAELLLTSIVSWATVAALIPIIPMALSLKTPAELEKEVHERREAERRLQELNENLERLVEERTREVHDKNRQLETANDELKAFSYSVSHDLKAPLRKIEQFNEMLQTRHGAVVEGEAQDYLNRIYGNTRQMNELIDDLLRFSRSASRDLNRQKVDLSEIGQQVASALRLEGGRPGDFIIEKGMTAWGDEALLTTVVENLLGNAWKYTSQQENPRVHFGEKKIDGKTVFFVNDNGIGFKSSDTDRLFKLFSRLHSKAEYPGTGIGLASVLRVMTRHGGKAWAEGEPGQGATFYFSLPDENSESLPAES